jgi:hypothetical protein
LIRWEDCKKKDLGNNQKITKKGCMPLYYCPKSFVSEVVSTSRSKTIGEKETHKATIKRQEKEGYSKRKVFFFKRPLNPTYISFKKDKQLKTRTTKRVIMMS